MREQQWKSMIENGQHLDLDSSEFASFTFWLNNEGIGIGEIIDKRAILIKELCSVLHPYWPSQHADFIKSEKDWLEKAESGYGKWVYYPWLNKIVWLLELTEFLLVRTSRNKHLITEQEQEELQRKSIGIVGLSVGHSIAAALAMECCGRELRLADFDSLDLSNLNRIRASVVQIGLPKTTIAYRTLSEINPYLKIKLWEDGLNESNIHEFLSGLDLVIEECDSLDIKILCREKARELQIPVLMETADRGMIDIERFDLEPNRPIFHGLAGDISATQLKGLTTEEKVPFVLPLVGGEHLSVRMKASMLEINRSIKSWPQLGAQVQMGSGLAADLARKILLNQVKVSGRFYLDPDKIFENESTSWFIEHEHVYSPANFIDLESCKKHSVKLGDHGIHPLPDEEQLVKWINLACLAPTGGNMQHWWWIQHGKTLYLYEDESRSFSYLNYRNSGSDFGFGAAIENLSLAAKHDGVKLNVNYFPDSTFTSCIASITAVKQEIEVSDSDYRLFNAITVRCTDRRANGIPVEHIGNLETELSKLIQSSRFRLSLTQDVSLIQQTSEEVGLADRLRLLNPQAHADFLGEMRWTKEENDSRLDGIDIATCYLNPSDLAVIGIAKDRNAFEFLEQQRLGKGLGELTAKLVRESPGLGLLIGNSDDRISYLDAGSIAERIWLEANGLSISFQPVSPITFLYLRNRGGGPGLLKWQKQLLSESESRFRIAWKINTYEYPLFLFRFFKQNSFPVRSLRRPVNEVFFKQQV